MRKPSSWSDSNRNIVTRPVPKQGRIGLLAGGGDFPIIFAKSIQQRGYEVTCIGIREEASLELKQFCTEFHWAGISKIGRMIRLFHRSGISHIVMAGKLTKGRIFAPRRLLHFLPDWRPLHLWYTYLKQDKKDDTLLLAVIQEFARDNFQFDSALDYCPELLVKQGCLTRKQPTPSQMEDILFGWKIANEMGRLDIGQSVILKEKATLAIEAIEGTDRAIQRAGEFCPSGNFTVVKVEKPQQDRRFDVPTIGVNTIETIHQAGGKVLAIESNKTIILNEPEVVQLADQLGLCVVAIDEKQITERMEEEAQQ